MTKLEILNDQAKDIIDNLNLICKLTESTDVTAAQIDSCFENIITHAEVISVIAERSMIIRRPSSRG